MVNANFDFNYNYFPAKKKVTSYQFKFILEFQKESYQFKFILELKYTFQFDKKKPNCINREQCPNFLFYMILSRLLREFPVRRHCEN